MANQFTDDTWILLLSEAIKSFKCGHRNSGDLDPQRLARLSIQANKLVGSRAFSEITHYIVQNHSKAS